MIQIKNENNAIIFKTGSFEKRVRLTTCIKCILFVDDFNYDIYTNVNLCNSAKTQ